MEITIQKNVEIQSVDDWFFCAPPKGKEKQWKDNYSAKELATFATSPEFKPFIENLLSECKIKCDEFICIPEAETNLPGDYRGPRNHDLLMIGKNVIIGIEAKVNEPYGNSIEQELKDCSKGKKERINWMKKVLFNGDCDNNKIKYQLMTGVCGTLLEAVRKNVEKCIFLVLSFNIDGVESNKQNEKAFESFIKQLGMNGAGDKSFLVNTEDTGDKRIICHILKKNIIIPLRYKF